MCQAKNITFVLLLSYLSELLRYTNGPRLLRSSSQNFLAVPRTRLKTYGDRAFSAAAPRLWNQLPPELNQPNHTAACTRNPTYAFTGTACVRLKYYFRFTIISKVHALPVIL